MKRIISASYKSDIPAFFAEKFFEDLKKGYTIDERGNLISLRPEDVSCFVFWTKNCSDYFRAHLQDLDRTMIPYYFQWTISGYGKDVEPKVPDKRRVLANFKAVSEHVGLDRVIVRYDPIFISQKYSVEHHYSAFSHLCEYLEGYTNRCVISFLDEYRKIEPLIRAGVMRAPNEQEIASICENFAKVAKTHGIIVQTCAEGRYTPIATKYGIVDGACIDAKLIESIFKVDMSEQIKKDKRGNTFRRCACSSNIDIGSYRTCKHNCKYCYAN